MQFGKRPREEREAPAAPAEGGADAKPQQQKKKWPGVPHGNRKWGPAIVLKEDGYVIREDERPDHVVKREKANRPPMPPRGGGGDGGAGAAGGQGRYEECWICGQTDHRRSDCPNKAEWGADRHSVQRKLVCLGCRKKGHVLKDCPDQGALGDKGGAFCCYNCGSTEHGIHACPEPQIGSGFSFASCFVCNSKGHLSRDCPKNAQHGLYPRGGGCKRCGSTAHFVKDCPSGGEARGEAAPPSSKGHRREEASDDGGEESAAAAAPPSRKRAAPISDEADLGGNVAYDDEAGKREKRAKKAGAYPSHGKPFKGKGRK